MVLNNRAGWHIVALSTATLLALAGCATVPATSPGPPVAVAPPPAIPAPGPPPGGPGGPPPTGATTATTNYAAAIYVAGGRYLPARSATSAVSRGEITNTSASGFTIFVRRRDFNGVLVRGQNSVFTVSNAHITLIGDGSNDFVGLGAGAMAEGGATLILHHVDITTTGLIRSAIAVSGHSILKVYDSVLRANGGALPPGYRFRGGPGMISPPPGLHIGGTVRAALTMDNSRSYFYNTTIISSGWAGLSTDNANGYVYLEADDSTIRVTGPGYGIYADNSCVDVINASNIITKTYTGIIAGVGRITLNDVHVISGANSVMIHSVMGRTSESGVLNINGGVFNTGKAVILVRSSNAQISIDGAKFHPADGTLIQSIVSDDPNRTQVNGAPTPGINVALKNMNLAGNILHQDPERVMRLRFVNTKLRGTIEKATIELDPSSNWTATGNSTAKLIGAVAIAQIDALPGVAITAKAGVGCHLRGSYTLKSGGVLNISPE